MGGVITNLIGQNFMTKAQQNQQDAQEAGLQAQTYSYVLQDPDAPPQLKQNAHQGLMDLAEEHGGREVRDQLPQIDQYLRVAAAKPVILRKLQAMVQQQTPEINAQRKAVDQAAAAGQAPPATPSSLTPSQLADLPQQRPTPLILPVGQTALARRPAAAAAPADSAAAPSAATAPATNPLALSSGLAQFGGTLPALAGTAPAPAAPSAATPAPQQGQLRTWAGLPPEHHSRLERIANALVGFGGGITGNYPAWFQAQQQRRANQIAIQDQMQRIQQAVNQGIMTPQQGQEAIRYTLTGERTPAATRATIEEQTLQDALQAEADRLGKPVSQLTGAERYKVERELAAKPARAQTFQEQERQDALEAKAAELNKTVAQLTPAEVWQVDQSLTARRTGTGGEQDQLTRAYNTLDDPKATANEKKAAQNTIDKQTREPTAALSAKEADAEAEDIAGAIMRGEQDPNLTGLARGGVAAKVRDRLAKAGYNLLRAQNDLYATRRWMASMNNAQQLRLRQASEFATESLDVIDNPTTPGDDLIGKLRQAVPRTQFPALNRAAIAAARQGLFGEAAASAANQLDQQIADLQSELAVVYMGGNAPTDKGINQAQRMLQGEWSDKVLRDAVGLARTNLRLRINSISRTGPMGVTPQGRQQYNVPPPAAETPTPGQTPPSGGGVDYTYDPATGTLTPIKK